MGRDESHQDAPGCSTDWAGRFVSAVLRVKANRGNLRTRVVSIDSGVWHVTTPLEKPNAVFVMGDDGSAIAVGAVVATPRLKRCHELCAETFFSMLRVEHEHPDRPHIRLATELAAKINAEEDFELVVPPSISLFCFRYARRGCSTEEIDDLNERLLQTVNDSGQLYVTHTHVKGRFVIRFVVGQTYTEQKHVDRAWRTLCDTHD